MFLQTPERGSRKGWPMRSLLLLRLYVWMWRGIGSRCCLKLFKRDYLLVEITSSWLPPPPPPPVCPSICFAPLFCLTFLSTCPLAGLQHHGYMHGDAHAWRPPEDFSRKHPREDFLPVWQAPGLLQEEKQVSLDPLLHITLQTKPHSAEDDF